MISIMKATLCVLTLASVAHSSISGPRRRLTNFMPSMGTAIGIHLDPKFKPRTKQASTTEASTGLMDIGKQCAECNFLDMLPVQCDSCRMYFCKSHHQAHGSVFCAEFGQKPGPSDSRVAFDKKRCKEAKKTRRKFLSVLKKLHEGTMLAVEANPQLKQYWSNLNTTYSNAGYSEILDRNADGWLDGAGLNSRLHVSKPYRRCPACKGSRRQKQVRSGPTATRKPKKNMSKFQLDQLINTGNMKRVNASPFLPTQPACPECIGKGTIRGYLRQLERLSTQPKVMHTFTSPANVAIPWCQKTR